MLKNPTDAELAPLRQQIDALDDRIIALLIERIGVVARVGELKRAARPGLCPIRAGREADMLRRVMSKFEGTSFPPAAAAAMWRILIGASTCIENPLSLSVYVPERNDTLFWLAREYFGPTLPVTRQPHIKRVIGDVMDGKTSIGIVPALESGGTDDWWASLLPSEENMPKIFACLPFLNDGSASPAAMAIACITPEATGDDLSLLALDTDGNASQHRLQNAFMQCKLQARWISITMPSSSIRRHLVEIKGFITADDAALQPLASDLGASLQKISFLGAYAAPVPIKTAQPAFSAYAVSARP